MWRRVNRYSMPQPAKPTMLGRDPNDPYGNGPTEPARCPSIIIHVQPRGGLLLLAMIPRKQAPCLPSSGSRRVPC